MRVTQFLRSSDVVAGLVDLLHKVDPTFEIFQSAHAEMPTTPSSETAEGWRDRCVAGSPQSSRHDRSELFSAAHTGLGVAGFRLRCMNEPPENTAWADYEVAARVIIGLQENVSVGRAIAEVAGKSDDRLTEAF